MHHAIARILRVFQPGNQPEDAPLFGKLEVCLEPDDVEEPAVLIVLPKLNHGKRLLAVHLQTDGFERAEAERHLSALGHDLHRHTALEHARRFECMQLGCFGTDQRTVEREVFVLRHGAVEVIVPASVAGRAVDLDQIQRFVGNDRCRRVVKMQRLPGQAGNILRQRVGGQRPARDNRGRIRYARDLFVMNRDVRVLAQQLRDPRGKSLAVDRERTARGNARFVRNAKNERTKHTHLLLE
ncbi:hypothetical protein SDC9_154891 [bioreactor metagenome]|uniref:Uncharacterized protein n=1 Tax=bioreactor metagenome TaxID=1076179 RepID=A0A645F1I0_9ZZZZ